MEIKTCLNCKKPLIGRKKPSEAKRSNWKFCSNKCKTIFNNRLRKLPSKEKMCEYCKKIFLGRTRAQLSKRFCSKICSTIWCNKNIPRNYIRGERSHFWQGGKTEASKKIKSSLGYKLWRKAVFERDNWTCMWCKEKGGNLTADHIKPFSLFPELRLAIDNGRTLCRDCHKKTDTWGWKLSNKTRHIKL